MPDCVRSDPLPASPAAAATSTAWHASLRLRFADDAGTTRLVERAHHGPLRVQKALYPEGDKICHAIIVHPPGGVVGGDSLAIDVAAASKTHAFLTTPGAAKWYRSNGHVSRQRVDLKAGAGAVIEWLPQETIFYNDARVQLEHTVDLADDACYIGTEILCFGRRASGETYASGRVNQRTAIRRGGKLLWWEQGVLAGGSDTMRSPLGLNGASVCATLIAVGAPLPTALLAQLRALDPALVMSQVKSVFVARYLGDDSETARHLLARLWQGVRPHLLGCAATVPRIWHT